MTTRFTIRPRAPFRLDLTVWALRRRAHNAIDRYSGGVYRRALIFDGEALAVSVRQTGPPRTPLLEVAAQRPAHLCCDRASEQCIARFAREALERMLGPHIDLGGFMHATRKDPVLSPLAIAMRGLKPPRFPTVFEALANGIACQQLSLDVGIHLLNRLASSFGPAPAGAAAELHAFPGPVELAEAKSASLRRLGFSAAKARALVGAAGAVAAGALDLEGLASERREIAMERLTDLEGVGRWTAEYVLLRGLGRIDTFPVDDAGARNKLARVLRVEHRLDAASTASIVARWRPYAGIAYFHLLLDSLSQAGLVEG